MEPSAVYLFNLWRQNLNKSVTVSQETAVIYHMN